MARRAMDKSFATREWLDWLTRVRLLTITLILTVGVVWPQYIPGFSTNRFFLPLIIFWITLGILHLILLRWLPQAKCMRAAGHRRCADDFAPRLFHRPAGKLFHPSLSACDYCREHSVLATHSVLTAATVFWSLQK